MQNSVQYIPFVKDDENKGFDMHVHSTASDGRTTPKTLAKYLNKHGLSAAITDHNVISGVKEALDHSENIIPGIEVSALEGPHILVSVPVLVATIGTPSVIGRGSATYTPVGCTVPVTSTVKMS